jgi:hypothetical protein
MFLSEARRDAQTEVDAEKYCRGLKKLAHTTSRQPKKTFSRPITCIRINFSKSQACNRSLHISNNAGVFVTFFLQKNSVPAAGPA